MVIVQVPVAEVTPVVHVPPVRCAAGLTPGVTVTPGASTQPLPSFFSTLTVNTWPTLTAFTGVSGAMLIHAATYVLTPSAVPPSVVLGVVPVMRASGWPVTTGWVTEARTVKCPASVELIENLHLPSLPVAAVQAVGAVLGVAPV